MQQKINKILVTAKLNHGRVSTYFSNRKKTLESSIYSQNSEVNKELSNKMLQGTFSE